MVVVVGVLSLSLPTCLAFSLSLLSFMFLIFIMISEPFQTQSNIRRAGMFPLVVVVVVVLSYGPTPFSLFPWHILNFASPRLARLLVSWYLVTACPFLIRFELQIIFNCSVKRVSVL